MRLHVKNIFVLPKQKKIFTLSVEVRSGEMHILLTLKLSFIDSVYSWIWHLTNEDGKQTLWANDLTIGWQNLNPLSHPNATLAPQARASGENLNCVTMGWDDFCIGWYEVSPEQI